MSKIERLKKRREFLSVSNQGRAIVTSTMIVQWLEKQGDAESACPFRIGFTTSRRVGNAVVRNRARRRLRALTQTYFKSHPAPHGDMVVVGRSTTPQAKFSDLTSDFNLALQKLGA